MIVTVSGDTFCDGCYRDLVDPLDNDASMFVDRRESAGRCQCCGLDTRDESCLAIPTSPFALDLAACSETNS